MGMAASQARLLSITARLSNNEMEQQSIAYSKQRLAENTEQINDQYLDAMNATKYQFITGYNNSAANYADLTYNQITGVAALDSGKQYIVKSNKGQVLVSNAIAKAFKNNNGDFNKFLSDLGYTQSDIDVSSYVTSENAIHDAWDRYLVSVGKSIAAEGEDDEHILGFNWHKFSENNLDGYATYNTAFATTDETSISLYQDSDGYYMNNYALIAQMNASTGVNEVGYITVDEAGNKQFNSLGEYVECEEGEVGRYSVDDEGNASLNANGNYKYVAPVVYNAETNKYYMNYDEETGTYEDYDALYVMKDDPSTITTEQKNRLLDDGNGYVSESGVAYDVAAESKPLNYEGATVAQRELYDYAQAITEAYYNKANSNNLKFDAGMVTYYQNIFNEMSTCGYTTVDKLHSFGATNGNATSKVSGESSLFQDAEWFVDCLKSGELNLAYYSKVEKGFVPTTLDDDESITENVDSSKMAIEEQIYHTRMTKLQGQDKQFDLQLNRLESEHSALQTEYESVKGVISKNVEKSFNIFS